MAKQKKPRTLQDFATYVAAVEKLGEFKSQLAGIEEQIAELGPVPSEAQLSAEEIHRAAVAMVKTVAMPAAPVPERQEFIRNRDVTLKAIKLQEQIVSRELHAAGSEICADLKPEHERLCNTIVGHIVDLVYATRAEQQFIDALSTQDIDARSHLREPNYSQAPQIPRSIKHIDPRKIQRDNLPSHLAKPRLV